MLGSRLRSRLLPLAAAIAGVLLVPSAASAAYTFGDKITPVGSQEMVFDYSAQPRCGGDTHFFQDAGTRAVRDATGRVALIMSHAGTPNSSGQHTRRLIGPGLNLTNLPFSVDCTVIHSSHNSSQQRTFDNWEWLVSPFTEDGQTFHSLVHNEYHGWEHAGQCPVQGSYEPKCWYNAITLAKSTNRGDLYTHASSSPVANHLIATIPYQYDPSGPISKGYFQPTNIVKKGSFYYSIFRVEPYQDQSTRGACLMRTSNLDDPDSWRGWDGNANDDAQQGFTVDFVDPYADAGTFVPAEHRCATLSDLSIMANNMVYSRHFKRYMVVEQSNRNGIEGVYYSLSDDLINWDTPKLLMQARLAWTRTCSDAPDPGIRVPTLVDPNSTDRNFNTIGKSAHLYFVESHYLTTGTCPETLDRDLVRVKVRFDEKPAGDRQATLEGGTSTDPATGFDSVWNGTPGRFDIDSAFPAYDGSKSAKLTSLGGNTGPWGSFNVSWPNGKEAWYGSGFYLPAGFAITNDKITLMRWHNSAAVPPSPSRYGGIVLGTDDRYRLVRGVAGGAEDTIGPSFTIPDAKWVWLEVHQKLESDPAKSPLSEVFVDGKPVLDPANGVVGSTDPNAYADSAGVPNRVQYGWAERTQGNSTLMWIDGSSVSLSQRGPAGAPPTPGSFGGTEQDGLVTMYWQGPKPPGGGFRIYRRTGNARWSARFDTPGTGTFDTSVANCTRYEYRISAYDDQGRESVVSEPLELMPRPSQGCNP